MLNVKRCQLLDQCCLCALAFLQFWEEASFEDYEVNNKLMQNVIVHFTSLSFFFLQIVILMDFMDLKICLHTYVQTYK